MTLAALVAYLEAAGWRRTPPHRGESCDGWAAPRGGLHLWVPRAEPADWLQQARHLLTTIAHTSGATPEDITRSIAALEAP